jgi:hypothetical protein
MDVKDLESALTNIPGGKGSVGPFCGSQFRGSDSFFFSEGVEPTDELDQYLEPSVSVAVDGGDDSHGALSMEGLLAGTVSEHDGLPHMDEPQPPPPPSAEEARQTAQAASDAASGFCVR